MKLFIKIIKRRLCKTRDFVQDQSLNDFETAASRMLSGFEDYKVVQMQILGESTVFHSFLKMIKKALFTSKVIGLNC